MQSYTQAEQFLLILFNLSTFDLVDCTILLQYLPTVRSMCTADKDVNVPDMLGKLMMNDVLVLRTRV